NTFEEVSLCNFVFSFSRFFIGNPSSSVMPEIFYQASKSFKYCGPLIEPFRGDSPFLSFPKSLIGNPHLFNTYGPLIEAFRGRLKAA
ncbi:MAG: hypothetical protein QM228_03250, partial [Atribacterota bacterium]|nr:hypothetical protein [Atribacterota bacterium]